VRREYSKAVSLGIITVVYVIAAAAGILAFGKLGAALGEPWALLAADVIATVIVWGFGLSGLDAPANALTWLGFAICIAAASIQLIADTQSRRFRATHTGRVCDTGLWRRGRHPNYFGEISMWWGVWLMYASLCGLDWLILGPVAMTALFLFISIPLMESRQLANKPAYTSYRSRTRILIRPI
jgi:steroid 5-alpha reductase family enzyme